MYIVYEINLWQFTVSKEFALENSILGTVELTKNADFDKYKYSGYGIGFDAYGSFSLSDGTEFGKNVILFGAGMSSSMHIDNKNKDVLTFRKGPTDGLEDTTLTAEKEYSITFTEKHKKFGSSLHCNGVNSYIFDNAIEIYKFKSKIF